MASSATNDGWKELTCPYFYEIAVCTLQEFMEGEGFGEIRESPIGGAVFLRFGLFVEVSYVPETSPSYVATLIVGVGDSKYDADGRTTGVPLWFLLSRCGAGTASADSRFSTPNELRELLGRWRESHLVEVCAPLWSSQEELEAVLRDFEDSQLD